MSSKDVREYRLSIDFPCSKKSLLRARCKTLEFARKHGFSQEADDIALAAEEALKNVLQHACPADNKMHLEMSAKGDVLMVEVSDTGRGFDLEAYECAPHSPYDLCGRGIQIMRGLMDKVSIVSDADGTVVKMEKRRKTKKEDIRKQASG